MTLRFSILLFTSLFVRGTELEDYVIKNNDSWMYKNIAKCLSEVTELYASGNQDVIVIFREAYNEDAVPITAKYPNLVLTEKILTKKLFRTKSIATAYVFSNQSIPKILNYTFWDMSTKFIIVTTDESQIRTDFSAFWNERSVHVLALLYNHKTEHIHLLTFLPYTDGHCEDVQLSLLTIWNLTSGINASLFPPKVSNFHKCPLYVTLLERPPLVFEADNETIRGVEVNILKNVAKAINATPIFQFLHKKQTKYKSRGNKLMLQLTENHSHAVAGSLLMTKYVSFFSEGIEYSTSLCITIAVPKIKSASYFSIFTTVLTGHYYLLTTCIIFLYMIFFYVFYKTKEKSLTFSMICWMILSPLIGGPRINVKYFMPRMLFISWLFATFIFCKIFEASISSSVLAPEKSKQLENIEEVFQSALTLRGEFFLMQQVVPRYLPKNHSATVDFTPGPEESAMEIISKKKNLAFLGSEMNLLWTFLGNKDLEENIYLQKECVMRYSPVIQIRKRSPLYDVFQRYITALSESGVINETFDLILFNFFSKRRDRKIKTDVLPLSLKQISRAFVVLGLGLILSGICFVSEVVISILQQKHLYSQRKGFYFKNLVPKNSQAIKL